MTLWVTDMTLYATNRDVIALWKSWWGENGGEWGRMGHCYDIVLNLMYFVEILKND